jgi:riboflavin-specific deaminase-like protein
MRVTVHVAQSLDGRVALSGSRTTLSTPEGERAAHAARASHDAVLVGAETVRIDDPRLTVRHGRPGGHGQGPRNVDPLRVVLASDLEVPLQARVLDPGTRTARGRVLIVGAEGRAGADARRRLESRGADVAVVARTTDGLVSVESAVAHLAERGVRRLLVEGGARVLTSFFRARLVHRVEIEIAMRLLGAPGTPSLGLLGVTGIAEAPSLVNVSVERLGESVLLSGDVVFP